MNLRRRLAAGALAGATLAAALNGLTGIVNPPIEVKGRNNTVIVVRTIADAQPADVACQGAVTKSLISMPPSGGVYFYQARLADFTLAWTDSPDARDRFALTDGKAVVYPVADAKTRSCLLGRAVEVIAVR